MNNQIIDEINILKGKGVDMLHIKQVKNVAIEMKMYDLVVFINNNLCDYIGYVKKMF